MTQTLRLDQRMGLRRLWAWLSRPWRRSLQTRLVLAYGGVFLLALALLLARMGQVIYTSQLEEAEHTLEIEAFLAANALEDPLSGYAPEFEQHSDDDDGKGDKKKKDDEEHEQEEKESEHAPDPEDTLSGEEGLPPQWVRNAAVAPPSAPDQGERQFSDRLQFVAETYARDLGARVTILNAQGHALADSHYPPHQVPNQLTTIEVQAALQGKEQHDVRPDPFTGQMSIFAAAPVQQGDRILGVVQISQPLAPVIAHTRALLTRLVLTGLGALLLTAVLGIWLSRQLVRPIRHMERAALAMAAGDLDQRVPIETEDELGALARAFNHMAAQLREMLERQRLFVANASHELRTPLTNIKLRSEALVNNGVPDPALAQRYLGEIDREADRLIRLANTLLDLSRLESTEETSIPAEEIDPAAVLRPLTQAMALRAQAKGLDFQSAIPDRLPGIRVWPEHLEAIVVNLVDNAIKYTPAGGQVRLSVTVEAGRCRIQVTDTGLGIPPEDLPHIFDRFYRVDKARSRQSAAQGLGSGAGLGLYIVKTLVEQNGGQIQVESQPGRGTTFVVTFPVVGRSITAQGG